MQGYMFQLVALYLYHTAFRIDKKRHISNL